MDRTIKKMKEIERFYNTVSHHLRDLIEEAHNVWELDSISETIKTNYKIGNLRDLDFNWLMLEVNNKRSILKKEELLIKED